MGKTMERSAVIYGEHKAVELKGFSGSQQKELDTIIMDAIGEHRHWDVDWMAVHEVEARALKDSAMHDAHVKVGVIDGDLIWRAKADKFNGHQEYDAVLVKHYTNLVRENEKLKASQENEDDEADTEEASGEAVEFQAAVARLKSMPGYFSNLSPKQAQTKLAGRPVGSWLVRASREAGSVSYDRRNDNAQSPVGHYRIQNMEDYRKFTKFIEGPGKSKQVTS